MDFPDARGQASIDYVGILAIVALLFGVAATAVGAPWLAPRIAFAIRHGICVVSGALCTAREAREAGLEPCPIHRRSDAERLGAVAVIRLERGDSLLVERRSDGTASVSFVDSGQAGVEAGVGVALPGIAGSASAGAGVRFAAGQTFEFDDWVKAQRFLARFAREETTGGEIRNGLRGLCRRCPEWLKGDLRALPEPSARFLEGGTFDNFAAELGVEAPTGSGRDGTPVGLDVHGARAVVLGRRVSARQVTWYLRLQSDVVAELGAVMSSLDAGRHAEGVLEITTERGEPVLARVRASAAMTNQATVTGSGRDVAGVAELLRDTAASPQAGAKEGRAVEAVVALDLRDRGNRRAVEGLLHPGGSPLGWLERLRALARRLDVDGAVDLSVHRFARDATDHSLELGELVRFGGGYGRVQMTRDLIAAWSLKPGGSLRRREDCEAASLSSA